MFAAMLEGWARQQRPRFLDYESTIRPRLSTVRRLSEFSDQYPWQWQPAEAEAFFDFLRARRPNFAVSTARNYQNALRMFCEYVTDERYEWPRVCLDRFGRQPVQILHEWNSITHVSVYEDSPAGVRCPTTRSSSCSTRPTNRSSRSASADAKGRWLRCATR